MTAIDLTERRWGKFHRDPERSHVLPAYVYYDPEIYEREKEAIFYRTWQFMGHAGEVAEPGDYVSRTIHDQNIVIVRGKDQTLRAFHNVCQHRAHELLEGSGNVKVITCPYHAWSYDLDGRLRSARGSDRVAGFNPEEFCLKSVQVEAFLSFLFVNLDPAAPSLKSQTGNLDDEMRSFLPRLEDLTLAHRFSYDLKANWKNVIENFSECYHCPIVHQDLCTNVLDLSSYRIVTHDIHQSHHSRAHPPEKGAYAFDPKVSEHGQEFAAWWIFPNIAFEVYPGGYLNSFHIVPVGPERSLKYVDFYLPDKTPNAEQWSVMTYRDTTVEAEDLAIVESVQQGYHSRGYNQGRLIVDGDRREYSEHAVHHIQSLVLDALRADEATRP